MKKGDTLIEVAIAIAVFSLVAIGVVSVVGGSTSAAQNALEVTITREEIDAQAEALRYIHSSYIAGGKSNSANNRKYQSLWERITDRAITEEGSILDSVLNYSPTTCSELYDTKNDGNIYRQNAFIINTHYLGDPIDYTNKGQNSWSSPHDGEIYEKNTIFYADAANIGDTTVGQFVAPGTFPRVLYNSNYLNQNSLLDQNGNNTGMTKDYFGDQVKTVEGLYVVAVADMDTTIITTSSAGTPRRTAAFYDFYIRSCWFAPGADRPSTISTVIRLQDPALVQYDGTQVTYSSVEFYHQGSDGAGPVGRDERSTSGTEVNSPASITSVRAGYTLTGWRGTDGTSYKLGDPVPVSNGPYYAIWTLDPSAEVEPPALTPEVTPAPEPQSIDLTAVLNWASTHDLDLYFQIVGGPLISYNNKSFTSGDTIITRSPDGRGATNNTYTESLEALNLQPNQTYYLYVKNRDDRNNTTSNAFANTSATITVDGTTLSAPTTGVGAYWNVLVVRDGQITLRGTVTSTPDIGY